MTSKEALNEICKECNKTSDCDKKYGACPNFNKVWDDLEVLEELKRSHIEYIEEEDRCYFVLKNTKRKEKSFTSKTFSDFWKGVFSNDK